MDLKELSWTEIQEIRIAVEKHKENEWNSLTKRFIKNATFEQIKEAKKEFDMERNRR